MALILGGTQLALQVEKSDKYIWLAIVILVVNAINQGAVIIDNKFEPAKAAQDHFAAANSYQTLANEILGSIIHGDFAHDELYQERINQVRDASPEIPPGTKFDENDPEFRLLMDSITVRREESDSDEPSFQRRINGL